MDRVKTFLTLLKTRLLLYGVVALVVLLGLLAFVFSDRLPFLSTLRPNSRSTTPDVIQPTIVNGELILPKEVTLGQGGGLSELAKNNRLAVNSALLIPVYDQQEKLTGLRIVGEITNIGTQTIDGVNPIVRFFDAAGVSVGQKVGKNTAGYNFFSLAPLARTVYDVTVDAPPNSDKLEIVMNTTSATTSALFEPMKIASRSVEVKTAQSQTPPPQESSTSSSGELATPSAQPQIPVKFDYFTVSGSVVNITDDPFSEISVYAWVRGKDGKILSFSTQEFRNDLLTKDAKLDFRITLLPFRESVEYDNVEVAAWGKRYKLNL